MLNVYIEKSKNNAYRMRLEGHCNSAEKGEDLICSAASVLCMTMAENLKSNKAFLKQNPLIDINAGNSTLIWKPKRDCEALFEIVLDTVATGFRWLAKEYPEFVKINF